MASSTALLATFLIIYSFICPISGWPMSEKKELGYPSLAGGNMRRNVQSVLDHRPMLPNGKVFQYIGLIFESKTPTGMLEQYVELQLRERLWYRAEYHDLFIFPIYPHSVRIVNASSVAPDHGELGWRGSSWDGQRRGHVSVQDIKCYAYPNGTYVVQERLTRGREGEKVWMDVPTVSWSTGDGKMVFDEPDKPGYLYGQPVEFYQCV